MKAACRTANCDAETTRSAEWPEAVVVKEKPRAGDDWWSLQPIGVNSKTSIDDLIEQRLRTAGLSFSPPSPRKALIRRAYYDLIGLAPTPEEVSAFVEDPNPRAFQVVVDRLLDSPHYGERWGRHWLDVIRFGESIGYTAPSHMLLHQAFLLHSAALQALVLSYVEFDKFGLSGGG